MHKNVKMGVRTRLLLGVLQTLVIISYVQCASIEYHRGVREVGKGQNVTEEKTENQNAITTPKTNTTNLNDTKFDTEIETSSRGYQKSKIDGRSLNIDVEKYVSPDFHSKNNVYILPTSPEIEKYIYPDYGEHTTEIQNPTETDINQTAPLGDILSSKFKLIADSIKQNLDDIDPAIKYADKFQEEDNKYEISKLIDNAENHDNDTIVSLQVTDTKIAEQNGEETKGRKTKLTNLENRRNVDYKSSFIKNKTYDEKSKNPKEDTNKTEVNVPNKITDAIPTTTNVTIFNVTTVSPLVQNASKENNSTDKPQNNLVSSSESQTITTVTNRGSVKFGSSTNKPTDKPIKVTEKAIDFDNKGFSIPPSATAWSLTTLKDVPLNKTDKKKLQEPVLEENSIIKVTVPAPKTTESVNIITTEIPRNTDVVTTNIPLETTPTLFNKNETDFVSVKNETSEIPTTQKDENEILYTSQEIEPRTNTEVKLEKSTTENEPTESSNEPTESTNEPSSTIQFNNEDSTFNSASTTTVENDDTSETETITTDGGTVSEMETTKSTDDAETTNNTYSIEEIVQTKNPNDTIVAVTENPMLGKEYQTEIYTNTETHQTENTEPTENSSETKKEFNEIIHIEKKTGTTNPDNETKQFSTVPTTEVKPDLDVVPYTKVVPTGTVSVVTTPTISDVTTSTISTTEDYNNTATPGEMQTGSDQLSHGNDDSNSPGMIAAIAISSIGAVCLIILAGLLIVMRKRQKRVTYGQRCRPVNLDAYSLDNVSVYNSVRRKGITRASKRSYGNPAFDDPVVLSHRMNFPLLVKFSENYEEIIKEFDQIPQITACASDIPNGCEEKNRYANIVPLAETRVYLKTTEGDPLSDYINANYVTGPKDTKKYYIACQGPMENTINDFWRMIWEQNSRVVLMLTNLYENGIEKCADYLPASEVLDCHRIFGDFQVTLKKRDVKEKYIISTLEVRNMVSNSWREVFHLFYMGWPDRGVPSEANSLIAFLIEARSHLKTSHTNTLRDNKDTNGDYSLESGPMVVHCSPGTGRTGTVIACDIAVREFELTRAVDIPKIVYRIRRDRASAVQTKDQYTFIYKVIALYATKLTGEVLDPI